jgi:hypothetical protein
MIEFKQGLAPYKAMCLGFPNNLKVGDIVIPTHNLECGKGTGWIPTDTSKSDTSGVFCWKDKEYIIERISLLDNPYFFNIRCSDGYGFMWTVGESSMEQYFRIK